MIPNTTWMILRIASNRLWGITETPRPLPASAIRPRRRIPDLGPLHHLCQACPIILADVSVTALLDRATASNLTVVVRDVAMAALEIVQPAQARPTARMTGDTLRDEHQPVHQLEPLAPWPVDEDERRGLDSLLFFVEMIKKCFAELLLYTLFGYGYRTLFSWMDFISPEFFGSKPIGTADRVPSVETRRCLSKWTRSWAI